MNQFVNQVFRTCKSILPRRFFGIRPTDGKRLFVGTDSRQWSGTQCPDCRRAVGREWANASKDKKRRAQLDG